MERESMASNSITRSRAMASLCYSSTAATSPARSSRCSRSRRSPTSTCSSGPLRHQLLLRLPANHSAVRVEGSFYYAFQLALRDLNGEALDFFLDTHVATVSLPSSSEIATSME